jgi:hypothetical protein
MTDVLSALENNVDLISAFGTILTAVVWIVYAHIFLMNYIQENRPRVIIEQAHGDGPDPCFMLINLSKEPIHVSGIMVSFDVDGGEHVHRITDFEHITGEPDTPRQQEEILKQGPIQPGDFLTLGACDRLTGVPNDAPELVDGEPGTFSDRLRDSGGDIDEFEIRVVAMFGSRDRPIGATRRFSMAQDGDGVRRVVRPLGEYTRQLSSRWHRKTVRRWSRQIMELS